jgi:hypothetical protein
MVSRVVAIGFMLAGIMSTLLNMPILFPGGTVNVNGEPSTDIVIRSFSVFMPLIVVALGLALFRAKPFCSKEVQ